MHGGIGEQLKRARQERNLSLEKAAQVTHIRLRFLEALESDQADLLPSEAQARGFIRIYAGFLGIPSEPLIETWSGKPLASIVKSTSKVKTSNSSQVVLSSSQEAPSESDEPLTEDEIPAPSPDLPLPSPKRFQRIGQQLSIRRKSLNLTLDDVERFIHIRIHYLKALEEGKMDALPSPVQGRGMLSNYAAFLNMDVDAVLLEFAEALQIQREENLVENNPTHPGMKKKVITRRAAWRKFLTPDLLIIGGIIFALVIFVIWTASKVTSDSTQAGKVTAPSISDMLLGTPGAGLLPTGTQSNSISNTSSAGAAISTASPAVTLAIPTISTAPLQVYIVARQRAYLRVVVDSKVTFDGRTQPGNAYPFSGNSSIELLTGSGAALQVFFNQRDLGTLGLVGQVVALNFTKDGVRTPTPAASSTPSRTPVPSLTRQPTATVPSPTVTPFIP